MLFDDGSTTIEHDPVSMTMFVPNETTLHVSAAGSVIAAGVPYGRTLRRQRTIGLVLTDAELTAMQSFLDGLAGRSFSWTDTQGRIWTARWLGGFAPSEQLYTSVGHHLVTVRLALEAIADDTGRTAYANTDAGQMSIQKSGATQFHFPLAYRAPLDKVRIPAAFHVDTGQIVAIDANRRTARIDRTLQFDAMDDDFILELEDYFVDTLVGATYPMTVSHFRDADLSARWVGPFAFQMTDGLLWQGSIGLREEV